MINHNTASFPEHFARVTPIVGTALRQVRIALAGLPYAAPLVECLAASGIGRWLVAGQQYIEPEWQSRQNDATLFSHLCARHGDALALDWHSLPLDAWAAMVCKTRPDLVLAVGDSKTLAGALEAATIAQIPALVIKPPANLHPCQALVVFPGDQPPETLHCVQEAILDWDWQSSAPLLAGLARAILLRNTPLARTDLEALWSQGMRLLTIGGAHPFDIHWSEPQVTQPQAPQLYRTQPAARGTLLIAGLGSLGSVAGSLLKDHVSTCILADPDEVDCYNPARQAYTIADIGRPKAQALSAQLLGQGVQAIAVEKALDEQQTLELIDRYHITAALVATGTAADFAIARALRERDLPHVVGRCYPRARYWEAIIVDGQRGPALADLRGHLRLGPAPAPTPEQRAAYSDAGALEAEPATLVESGWAAAWLARITAQLLSPPGLRERWLLELLAAQRTCIVGGVATEETPTGPAYGIVLPGQIHAWGTGQITS